MTNMRSKKGFTVVELVIVIAVIAILSAVLIPTFGNLINKANESALQQNLTNAYTEYIIDSEGSYMAKDEVKVATKSDIDDAGIVIYVFNTTDNVWKKEAKAATGTYAVVVDDESNPKAFNGYYIFSYSA